MGFNWNMLLASGKSCIKKNAWFWSGKVAHSVFVTFEGYTLPQKENK
jgi:hypothetical protein